MLATLSRLIDESRIGGYGLPGVAPDTLRAAHGWSTPATSLAWVLSRNPHLIPIPGPRCAAHLTQFGQATDITLTPADLTRIDRILPPATATATTSSWQSSGIADAYPAWLRS